MLFWEKKEKVKIFSIRIRINEAPMLFQEERESFTFSQLKFEFGFLRHPWYFRKKKKSLKFSQFEFELMRASMFIVGRKAKSLNFLNSNSNSNL